MKPLLLLLSPVPPMRALPSAARSSFLSSKGWARVGWLKLTHLAWHSRISKQMVALHSLPEEMDNSLASVREQSNKTNNCPGLNTWTTHMKELASCFAFLRPKSIHIVHWSYDETPAEDLECFHGRLVRFCHRSGILGYCRPKIGVGSWKRDGRPMTSGEDCWKPHPLVP